jgi:superfamily II DNA/RNA helicase
VQFVLSAATISTHGKHSVDQYLQKRFPRAERIISESFHKHHPRIEQDFLHVDILQSGVESGEREGEREEREREGGVAKHSVMTPARVELVFRALVGALPPRDDEGSEEDTSEDNNQDITKEWHRDQWKEAGTFTAQDIPPTMIFANTAGKARDLATALMDFEGGILAGAVAEFHKYVPTYDKQDALEKFRHHEDSGVKILVCTDAAAR